MRNIAVFLIALLVLTVFAPAAQAKLLPQSAKTGKTTTFKSSGTTIGVYPKLLPGKRGVTVSFTNLQNAKQVSYMLIYETSVQQEAASGGLNLKGQNSEKVELLFATCSANVCRYHSGIKNARLEVSYTTNSGKKYLKKFKIKV